ncbi:MAG: 2-oxoisovalerate dehydrogenase, partial [Bacteroidetes bacterium]|nr:2-oxoisovalerate dehydrogenase [Bacteroidota bacterium]
YNAPKAATPIPDDFEVPFGKARIRREGKDMSMITYGNTTHMCLEAAEKIAQESGYEVEVLDLRSLLPLDEEAIINTVKKTSKVLIVHEDKIFSGFGGEISALISDKAFEYLDAPVKRVGSTFTPVGFNRILEKAILPDTDKIEKAAKELLAY